MIIRFIRRKARKNPSKTGGSTHHQPHWGRRLLAVILLAALVLIATAFLYYTGDDQIRKFSIQTLAELTGGQVKLNHAEFSNFSEIRITGLRVHTVATGHSKENPILTTQDLLIRIDPLKLLMGKFDIQEIVILQGHLKIWYDRDKGISNLNLLEFGEDSDEPMVLPALYLRDCAFEYVEINNAVRGPKARQELTGRIRPMAKNSSRYEFSFDSGDTGVIKQARLEGTFDVTSKTPTKIRLSFQLKNTDLSNLPTSFSRLIRAYQEARPSGEVTLDWTYTPASGVDLELDLRNAMARLPFPEPDAHLQNINAAIHIQNDIIEVKNCRGELEDQCGFYLQGTIAGYDETAALDLKMGTESLKVPPRQWSNAANVKDRSEFLKQIVDSIPWKIRRAIESLSPTGTLDVALQVKRKAGESQPINVYGTVLCHHVKMIYEKFPYPLHDVSGTVRFDPNEVVVGPMISNKDDMKLIYEGRWQREAGKPSFDMSVHVINGPLDDALYQALNTKQQAIWDQFHPKNKINATYRIRRPANERAFWKIDVDLLGVDAAYQRFSMPMTEIQGQLVISRDQTDIKIHSAQAKGGKVALTGKYRHPQAGEEDFESKITFNNVTIDEEFFSFFPESTRQRYRPLELKGQCDGQVNIRTSFDRSTENVPKIDYEIEAQLRAGQVNVAPFNVPLQDVEAQLHLTHEQITIQSLQGRYASSRIDLKGQLTDPNDYQLHLEAKNLVLDRPLQQLVSFYEPDLWEALSPGGMMNLSLDMERPRDALTPTITGTIEPTNASFRLAKIDYLFEKVSGTIAIEPNQIVFDQINSQTGPGKFVFSGSWPRNRQDRHEFHFRGEDVTISEQVLAALPEPIMNYFKQIKLEGNLETDLKIAYQNNPDQGGLWEFDGWLKLNEGQLNQPMACEAINILWEGKLGYETDTQKLWSEGTLRDGSALVRKRPLKALQAQILYSNETHILSISNIAGRLCEGQLGGQIKLFFPAGGPGYELQLAVRQVDLKSLLESDKPPQDRKKKLRGFLEGDYNISKKDSQSLRTGFFQFNIEKAVIGELPVAAILLYIPNLSFPKEGAFNEVQISGNIIDQVVRFDSLFLKGSALSLQGVGQMTEPGHNLDLIFLVGSPHDLTPIPGFSDLFTAIKPALLHLHVHGPFDQPKVDTIAFSAFQKFLRYFSGMVTKPLLTH